MDSIVKDYITMDWNNEQWSIGAFDIFYPGQKKVFLYDMLKPDYDNRVFFAGEHTSRKHGWIQGAVYSSLGAADGLARHSRIQISK